MARKVSHAVIDTYAIIADITGQATLNATQLLESVRTGRVKGIIHFLIVYELTYHWKKKRLPFLNEEELKEFVKSYFTLIKLNAEDAIATAKIKIQGNKLLKNASNEKLRQRKLSVSDALSITLAAKLKIPIVSGDPDLSYVARKIGVPIIW